MQLCHWLFELFYLSYLWVTILVHLSLLLRWRVFTTCRKLFSALLCLEGNEKVPQNGIELPVIDRARVVELEFDVNLLMMFGGRVCWRDTFDNRGFGLDLWFAHIVAPLSHVSRVAGEDTVLVGFEVEEVGSSDRLGGCLRSPVGHYLVLVAKCFCQYLYDLDSIVYRIDWWQSLTALTMRQDIIFGRKVLLVDLATIYAVDIIVRATYCGRLADKFESGRGEDRAHTLAQLCSLTFIH